MDRGLSDVISDDPRDDVTLLSVSDLPCFFGPALA
jgi:hypothetical protein